MSKALIIGLIVGFIILALLVGLGIYFYEKKSNGSNVPTGPTGPTGPNGTNTVTCQIPSGTWTKSCTNDSLNGSILTASCNNHMGVSVQSSLDLNTCAPGDIYTNDQGHLVCNPGTGFCASQ